MRKIIGAAALTLALVGLLSAAAYEEVASPHDLMEMVVKPAMDKLAAMKKAGGPQNDTDWKHAKAASSILAESSQLLMMGKRVKDDVWTDGAEKLFSGAKGTMTASESHDMAAWNAGLAGIGGGCRSCHKAHKPKKGAAK